MNLVTILAELRRMRLFVAIVAVFALLATLAVAFKLPSLESRRYEVGVATARVLVDTPKSQVLEVAPTGSDLLGARANLIANLMVEGDVKAAVAEKAGLKPGELTGVAEAAVDPTEDPAPPKGRGNVLSTRVIASTEGDLPLIEIEAQGADAASAIKLADSAVDGLREYLDSKAASEKVSEAKRLQVTGLGGAQAVGSVRGPSLLTALLAGVFVFVAGCGAILLGGALMRGWRASAVDDYLPLDSGSELAAIDELFEFDDWSESEGGPAGDGDADASAKSA